MFKKFYKLLMVLVPLFALMGAQNLQAQEMTVTGNVSEMDLPGGLPGVNVIIQGTTQGTVTSVDGDYSITVPGPGSVLVFSSVGYISEEVTVGNQSTINITLVPDITSMEEVVVVGYGTTKKVNLTGAVDIVKAERLENRPLSSAGEGLQGLSPNLNITVPNGDPSTGARFNIRGFESINGGEPLVLIDNIPMDLNLINPDDIETFTVLKDGAASAIYGARAAFGVILITTKSGKKGLNIKLSTQQSWDKPIWHVDPITDGYTYALERNKVSTRGGGDPYYTPEYMEGLQRYWEDPMNNPAYEIVEGVFQNYEYNNLSNSLMNSVQPRRKYDLAISGATDKANYYTSIGYFQKEGFYNHPGNDEFKRYNILMKAEFQARDWLSFNQQVTANIYRSDQPNASLNDVIRTEPIRGFVVPRLDGYEEYEGMYWNNPFEILPRLASGGRETDARNDIWLKSGVRVEPLKRLSIVSDFSYNIFNREVQDAEPPFEMVSMTLDQDNPVQRFGDDDISVQRQANQYYIINAYAEYLVDDLEDHFIKGMVGFNQEWEYNTTVSGESTTFLSPGIIDIGATSGVQQISGSKSHVALRGAFFRLNYNYKNRYLFESNGRYDGTSRFSSKDRFGFFPSFSVGWRISEEPFMAATRSVIDNFKLRASYGSLGNQLLGNDRYPYIAAMGSGFSNFVMGSGQTPYVRPPGLISPNLTWESVISKNIALDVTMFKSRLDLSVDFYTRETVDMLRRMEYPAVLGTGAPQENAADLMTKGWEFSIKWRDAISNDLDYYLDFNLADWSAEITKYDNPTGAINDYYVGQKLGEIWGYTSAGIIQDDEQLANLPDHSRVNNDIMVGDMSYADLNGDGEISQGTNTLDDPGDRKIIGNETPRYSFGFNAGVTYKGIFLDLFFQGVGQRDYYPSTANWTWFFPWRSYNGDNSWLADSWTPDNRDAYFPEAQLGTSSIQSQTRYLQNAGYIRLKQLNLGYNLPTSIVNKIGLTNAKVFLGGQNLWEFSKIRKPLDPEYVFNNSIAYPLARTYTVGVIVNL